MIFIKLSIISILIGLLLMILSISITDGKKQNHFKQFNKRQLLDNLLTGLDPIPNLVPIVNHGLPLLSSLLINHTVTEVCEQLDQIKSKKAEVLYVGSLDYISSVDHYMSSSAALPSCIFRPATNQDVIHALKMISEERISFSINSGKHTGNPGFSSTFGGLQIDMRLFTQIEISEDASCIDIGPGLVWEDVYDALEGSQRTVLGGRVSGVGVGGFLLGGGGYSYLTQKYGMAADSIIGIDIVLPNQSKIITISETNYPDLFWAVKGGGNQFGIVTNFKLKTFPISSQIWGGTRLYLGHNQELQEAALSFANEVKDKNAAAILEFIYFVKTPIFAAEVFYDGPQPPSGIFDRFPTGLLHPLVDSWGPTNLPKIVRGVPSNLTQDLRGFFNSVSVQEFTPGILQVTLAELERLNGELLRTGLYFHAAFEWAGQNYGAYANPSSSSPFPYYKSPQPIELYFAWLNPLDDDYYREAINGMAEKIRAQARSEGQQVDDLPIYPNYAIDNTPANMLFGSKNAARMKQIKQKYDPDNVMRLTTWYNF